MKTKIQRLMTEAGASLRDLPWNRYPRPRMVREDWLCLNGTWQLTHQGRSADIRVPFCPESLLSGCSLPVRYGEPLIYTRSFSLPASWAGKRVLLHFGAVSRIADVRVNGIAVAHHEESYLPFSADITEALKPGRNMLEVQAVNDLSRQHPWGKQKEDRGGMWYTPVSGIWQTVWLEPVPEQYIRALRITTGSDWAEIRTEPAADGTLELDGETLPVTAGRTRITFSEPHRWSPENPYLYRFSIRCGDDRIQSYFALRTLSVRTFSGVPRLCLNDQPVFFHGLLDQGYWSDGLYTPADPDCYARDILSMKALGFNTLRKHIKIEPEQFYYDCDRLGMFVFQDMVSSGEYRYIRDTFLPTVGFQRRDDRRMHRDPKTREIFLETMQETVWLLRNHPSVCLWTIFNEGWGQFCADDAYTLLKSLDPTRFIDTTSGWFRRRKSDVESLHIYFQKLHVGKEHRPQLLSEIGGWSCKIPGHSFNTEETYGYRKYDSRESFVADLRALYLEQILPLIPAGLCGTVYTQVSDVEDETNGLLTWDRRVAKLLPEEFADIGALLAQRMQAKSSAP